MNPIGLIFVTLIFGDDLNQCPAPTLESTNRTISDNLRFIFYPPGLQKLGQNTTIYPYNYSLQILNNPQYDPTKNTIFYHHGLNENCTHLQKDQSCYRIFKGFTNYEKVNLIMLDYAPLVAKDDWTGSENVDNMGPLLCKFYKNFFNICNCQNTTEIIGYSMGSQSIHATFKNCSVKPYSVVSLDAGNLPYFQRNHINQSDAYFVQAIHTSGGNYGLKPSYGTVDFFPNGGQMQKPICYPRSEIMNLFNNNTVVCSHYSSVIYFMNTVKNRYMYPATKCNKRFFKKTYYMGYGLDKRAHGDFCLNINSVPKLD